MTAPFLRRSAPLAVLLVLVAVPLPLHAADPLDVVLVQYRVDPGDYASLPAFQRRVEAVVDRAVERFDPDLVVFPEYVSVFAMFSGMIDDDGTLEPARIPEGVARAAFGVADGELPPVTPAVHEFVRTLSRQYADRLRGIWSSVAAESGVWILAGSAFVPGDDGEVHNRVWVFDGQGNLAYRQDKVFLTDYERRVLGLDPGSLGTARPVSIGGRQLSITVCRDSFFDVWEDRFAAVDAWIDVRANGEVWDTAVRRRFDEALPERVADTPVELGMSTALNGRFFDLLWQGPAFVVDGDGDRVRQSPTVDGDYLMEVTVPGS